jgi:hypothetical protein
MEDVLTSILAFIYTISHWFVEKIVGIIEGNMPRSGGNSRSLIWENPYHSSFKPRRAPLEKPSNDSGNHVLGHLGSNERHQN